jgi:hypothetical protein
VLLANKSGTAHQCVPLPACAGIPFEYPRSGSNARTQLRQPLLCPLTCGARTPIFWHDEPALAEPIRAGTNRIERRDPRLPGLPLDIRPPRFCPRSELPASDKNLREARYVLGEQTSEVWTLQQPYLDAPAI